MLFLDLPFLSVKKKVERFLFFIFCDYFRNWNTPCKYFIISCKTTKEVSHVKFWPKRTFNYKYIPILVPPKSAENVTYEQTNRLTRFLCISRNPQLKPFPFN